MYSNRVITYKKTYAFLTSMLYRIVKIKICKIIENLIMKKYLHLYHI